MNLNFSNDKYKKIAMELGMNMPNSDEILHSNEDALLMCLKGLVYEDMDQYCNLLALRTNNNAYNCYMMIQNNSLTKELKEVLIPVAYECISDMKNGALGSRMSNDKRFVMSGWISHVLYEAKLASELASLCGLNQDVAFQMGLLHDIGRKKTHDFMHTIKGFELLVDEGWYKESLCCLTHSFLMDMTSETYKGGRFANCDACEDGFYVDNKITAHYEKMNFNDDIMDFLSIYNYNMYDIILNVADLMATNSAIVSPYDRVLDVATRKTPDIRNRCYMLNNFINTLNYYLLSVEDNLDKFSIIRINDLDETMIVFKEMSDLFFEKYNLLKNKDLMEKTLK